MCRFFFSLTMRAVPLLAMGLLVGALVGAHGLEGQEGASLVGIVLSDGSDQPLPGVTVMIRETQLSVVTDDNGAFFFPEVTPGPVILSASLDGYASVVEALEIAPSEAGLVQLKLPLVSAALDEILVIVERGSRRAGQHEESIRNNDGDLGTVADLLEGMVSGLELRRNDGSVGGGSRVLLRGPSSLSLNNGPAIYLDGIRVSSRTGSLSSRNSAALDLLETIPASVVARIRILRGPSASAQYPDANNGVILIETRRGESRGQAASGDN